MSARKRTTPKSSTPTSSESSKISEIDRDFFDKMQFDRKVQDRMTKEIGLGPRRVGDEKDARKRAEKEYKIKFDDLNSDSFDVKGANVKVRDKRDAFSIFRNNFVLGKTILPLLMIVSMFLFFVFI